MKIGNLDLGHKLLVAPMAEISDSAFRIISKEYGAGLTFTQMVSAKGVVKNQFETLRLLSFPKYEKPIGVQLLGNNADYLRGAANELKQFQPNVIDFNCGCPVSRVTKLCMGAHLLDDPVNLGKLVKALVDAAGNIPVSVKLRLGKDPGKINIMDTAKAAEDNGASFITIHSRLKSDRYDQPSRWDYIAKVKEQIAIPVVGNGSVFTPQDAKELIEQTNCDSVMVARGILGNPFLFKRFNELMESGKDPGEPTPEEIKTVALKHLKLLVAEYGIQSGVNKVKKHIIWYYMKQPGIDLLINKLFACKEVAQLEELIEKHTLKIMNDNYPEADSNEIFKLFSYKVQFWLSEMTSEVK